MLFEAINFTNEIEEKKKPMCVWCINVMFLFLYRVVIGEREKIVQLLLFFCDKIHVAIMTMKVS